ncbi:MAG: glycosyltransferase [Rhodanobacteraceae bacterium]
MRDKRAAMNPVLVVVTSSFPIRGDGSEAAGSFVADLVEELAKHADVRVVAPGTRADREQWANGVEVIRYAAPSRPLSTLKPWRPADLRWIARVLRGGLAATRIAAAQDTRHVLALWGLPCGEWARRVALESDMEYSVWMLGSDVWSLGRMPVLRAMLARVIRQAKHAYADGHQLADEARRIGGVPVEFLPSTRRIDLVDPPPPRVQPPYRLLFLGRWHRNKGVDLLLDALALLSEDDWKRIECVEIHGGGPLESLVRERVSALQAQGRPVILGGFLGKREAEAAIVRADWVLIPSRIESIPIIFSDAMKLGRPVIATPVGDLRHLLDSACGILCNAVDASAITEALEAAISINARIDPQTLAVHVETFSLNTITTTLLAGGGIRTDE